jgi:hypothetical protein
VARDKPTPGIFSANLIKMDKERVNCKLCSKQLIESSLKRHMHILHSDQSKLDKVQCVLCNYSPRRQSSLDQHILVVNLGVKKWKCMLCDFAAGRSGSLANHVKKKLITSASCVMSPCLLLLILIFTSKQCMRNSGKKNVLIVIMQQHCHGIFLRT